MPSSRLKKFVSVLKQNKIDAYLVTKEINIQYLTGFPASESWLLVTPRGSFYITDFRYILEAQKGLKGTGVSIVRYEKSFYATLFQLAKRLKVRTLGFDSRHVSHAQYNQMKKHAAAGLKLVAHDNLIEPLRDIKEPAEVRQMQAALALNLKAYDFLKTVVRPGKTEYDVFLKLDNYVKSRQAGFSFPPIIASGPNSCFPHARVSRRKIRRNEPVLIDMGIDLNGYKSDLTRMFFLGKMPARVLEVCREVAVAQQNAIAAIKPGVTAGHVDDQARNYLKKKRLDSYFGHSLGHGVGLEIHETPRISTGNPTILQEGMVFTVEPAVYLPNEFGIRLEDMVLVTKTGCRLLSRTPNGPTYFNLS